MTLSDLLTGSKVSPEELSANLKYKNIKNSIVDQITSFKRIFIENMQFIVNDIIENRMYNNYCCNNPGRIEIPEEEKKELINTMGEKAFSTLDNFKNNINDLFEIENENEKEEKPEEPKIEIAIEPQPIAKTIVPVVNDMFGY